MARKVSVAWGLLQLRCGLANVAGRAARSRRTSNTLREVQMKNNSRRWLYVEIWAVSTTGLFALISALFPRWMEFLSGWRVDQQDGSVERITLMGMFVITFVIFALAAIAARSIPSTSANRNDGII